MKRFRATVWYALLVMLTALSMATTANAQKVGQKPECSAGMGGTACGEPDRASGIDSGVPSPEKSRQKPRSAGDDSPGLGAGIMDLPYTSAEENALLRSRISRRLAECADQSKGYVDAARWQRQRTSHPELNASSCISLEKDPSLYGGFVNRCDFKVVFKFCAYRPKKDAWTEAFDCEKTQGGMELIEPGEHLDAHTKNAEWIYWAGCRFPQATASDFKFEPGEGYGFRCMAWDEVEGGLSAEGDIKGCAALEVENEEREIMAAENKQRREAEAQAERQRELAERQREQIERERREEERLAREDIAAALKQQRASDAAARRQIPSTPLTNGGKPAGEPLIDGDWKCETYQSSGGWAVDQPDLHFAKSAGGLIESTISRVKWSQELRRVSSDRFEYTDRNCDPQCSQTTITFLSKNSATKDFTSFEPGREGGTRQKCIRRN